MHASVSSAFVAFSSPLEGVCPFLYLDVLGLVTTAIGVLVDPIESALTLPFVHPDGRTATRAEIAAEWTNVKARQDMRLRGGGWFRTITRLRLTDEGLLEVVRRKLELFESQLTKRFPGFPNWPADAQLATLSVTWACGAGFRFPKLAAALEGRDFVRAARECSISTVGNPGVKPRNIANRMLYLNAARVLAEELDATALYWPRDLVAERPTEPSLENPPSSPLPFEIVHPFHFRDDDGGDGTA